MAASAWSGVTGAVGTFTQKTGNWFAGEGFNSDDQVIDIKLARYQELINNPILMAANGGEGQAEMFAWKSASERANEMSQIAEKITPQQLEYAILRSGMSKEDAEKLRQMYSLDKGSELNTEENLNLNPGLRVNAVHATGKPVLEITSYINDNYNQRGMSGVEGMQIMKLDIGDGTQVELVVDGAYWAQKDENEHPTDETDEEEYYKLSVNKNERLITKQGVIKAHNEFYPFHVNTNGKEQSIFLHSGLQSEGCFVTGGRLVKPDNNSIRFNQYIRQAIGNNSYLKTTHRIIDVRPNQLKKSYPLP